MSHDDANGPFQPSKSQVANAVDAIRGLVVRATTDKYPADIAAPTALYLGVAAATLWSGINARTLATICDIHVPDALEFAGLVEIAARSEWIRHDVVQAAILALIGKGDCPDPAPARAPVAPPAPAVQPALEKPRQITGDSRNGVRNLLPRRLTRAVIQSTPSTGGGSGGPVTIMGLNQNTCRWPLGDRHERAKLFCGDHPTHGPYCEKHHILAHPQKAEQKSGAA